MARAAANRVKETSTTTGTGTYDLAGAMTGFQTFVAGVGNGLLCLYYATDGTDWECGLGTVTDGTPDTLARTRVLESSNGDAAVNWAAGTREIGLAILAGNPLKDLVVNRGHLWDLQMSNAADALNDITVAAGEAADESGEVLMVLAAAITKRLDAAWAVGTDQGGLNTGSEAPSTWYEVHLIQRQDTGVVDVMFTTTANRATLPAGYTHQRRIGWIHNDGSSNILAFTQIGDVFTLTTPVNDVSTTSSASATARTVTVPPSAIGRFRVSCLGNTGINAANAVVFSEGFEADTAPTTTNGYNTIGSGDFAVQGACHVELRVSGSSQIRDRSVTATGSMAYDVSTYGWIDDRRRFANQ